MKEINFLQLMGRGKRCWKHVNTKERVHQLKEFEKAFIRNFRFPGETVLIPEIIHFIWFGPKEYPKQSRKYLQGWVEKHPSWKVYFWSDRFHNVPVEQRKVESDLLGEYQALYEESDNFGERSDLVRLLVLKKMGGVYIDHDMECRRPFTDLHRSYSFYGGLLTPGNPVIPRSAIVRNSVIGASPEHPILSKALQKMKLNWQEIGLKYVGKDTASVKARVTLRSFLPFHESVLESMREPGFSGIVFPAGCFNEIERDFGLFAKEDMVGAWYTEGMTHHEEYLKERLYRMMKRMHLFMVVSGGAIIILFILVGLLCLKSFF